MSIPERQSQTDFSDCIIYPGYKEKKPGYNYGRQEFQGRCDRAHRVAWIKAHGPIPTGMRVCHKCDNPPCINLEHLFLGTQSENCLDRERKRRGRDSRGEKSGRNKLTEFAVKTILLCRICGCSRGYLAKTYGIAEGTIGAISARKTWKHITLPNFF